MSLVNWCFDQNTHGIWLVWSKVYCVSCNLKKNNFEAASRCYRCLCADCMNQSLHGTIVPIGYSLKTNVVKYFGYRATYRLTDVSICEIITKMKQLHINIVPTPLFGDILPACVRCHFKAGKKETMDKLGRQLCWTCLTEFNPVTKSAAF